MSSVTISLHSQSSTQRPSLDKTTDNQEVEASSSKQPFDKVLADVASDIEAQSGKELPKEDSVMSDSQKSQSYGFENIAHLDQRLSIRKAGEINLIGLDNELQIPEFFNAIEKPAEKVGSASIVMLDVEWLRLKGNPPVDPVNSLAMKQQNGGGAVPLAEALALQMVEGRLPANNVSEIVELFDVRKVSGQLSKLSVDLESNALEIKMSDLIPGIKGRVPSASGHAEQNSGQSPSTYDQSSSYQFDRNSLGSDDKDFREFLADHLRKADSMKEMSDRLGNIIARQIAAQIGRGRWSLEIAMHPAELGSIEIEMQMTERGLEASFRASQAVTRDLLMESMPRLKSWFEEGGIDVAYTGLAQDSDAQNGGNSTGEQKAAQSELMSAEGDESPELTDNQLVGDGSVRLDIRV